VAQETILMSGSQQQTCCVSLSTLLGRASVISAVDQANTFVKYVFSAGCYAQHCPTVSETPPYAPWSSRLGSEPPSVENDVNVWRYAVLQLHARNDDAMQAWPLPSCGVCLWVHLSRS